MIRIATLIVLYATAAHAGPNESARAHFEAGRKLASQGKCAEAIDEFAAGHALSPRPLFLFNMAECARSLGQTERARELYTRFLAEAPDDTLAPTARLRLAALPAPPPPAPLPTPTQAAELHISLESQPTVLPPAPRAESKRPVWRRPVFWAAGAGVLVAGTVAIYVATRSDSSASCTGSCVNFR